ncbi:MAG: alpha-galactosidase [Actinobacteria bacterium]|nr:alpha-galactosidase [Actinomycetota bacterium]
MDEVPVDPARARVYAEGWQSWSPATWYPVDGTGLRPAASTEHTMRFRPGTPLHTEGIQAEGLLVLDPGDAPARVYGATEASEDVPTLVLTYRDGIAQVTSTSPVETHTLDGRVTDVLTDYAAAFGTQAGARHAPAPRVWCSWYRYFEQVTSTDIIDTLDTLDALEMPVDVVQIDDGWSTGIGNGLRPRNGFGDLVGLVDRVRQTGRRTGLWLAPFVVGRETDVAHEQPDWLTSPAGFNWGQELVGLDLTHPGVRDYLTTTLTRLRDIGVDYLKLDFLYPGAAPARRYHDVPGVQAYRSGLQLIREVMGPETFLLGCGAPLLPSVGLVDGMRVSSDTFHEGTEDGSTGLRGLMSLTARAWQHGRFWVNDPDSLVARSSYSLREPWSQAFETYGGLRSCSDRLAELDPWGLDTTRRLMSEQPPEAFKDQVLARGAQIAMDERTARQEGHTTP